MARIRNTVTGIAFISELFLCLLIHAAEELNTVEINMIEPAASLVAYCLSQSQERKNNILWDALKQSNTIVMDAVLDCGADIHALSQGLQPIHVAAGNGDVDMIQFIVQKGGFTNAPAAKENRGVKPIHCATMHDKREALLFFLHNGIAYNEQDYHGDTPIHWAAYRGCVSALQLLLEYECSSDLVYSDRGRKALIFNQLSFHPSSALFSSAFPYSVISHIIEYEGVFTSQAMLQNNAKETALQVAQKRKITAKSNMSKSALIRCISLLESQEIKLTTIAIIAGQLITHVPLCLARVIISYTQNL